MTRPTVEEVQARAVRAISFTVALAATLLAAVAAWAAPGDLLWVDRVDRSGGVALDAGHAAAAAGGRFFASGSSAVHLSECGAPSLASVEEERAGR